MTIKGRRGRKMTEGKPEMEAKEFSVIGDIEAADRRGERRRKKSDRK